MVRAGEPGRLQRGRDALTAFGQTLLGRAAAAGDQACAEVLTGNEYISNGGEFGREVGLEASAKGHEAFVEWFVRWPAGAADPDWVECRYDAWITAACFGRHYELAGWLAYSSADFGWQDFPAWEGELRARGLSDVIDWAAKHLGCTPTRAE